MSRPRLVQAARVLCYINGRLVGRVAAIEFSPASPHREARGVDDPTVQEFMPTTVGVVGAITLLRTLGDGASQGAGITVPQSVISREKYFTITLVEREFDQTIFEATECVANSESWSIVAKDLIRGHVSFMGRTYSNEVGG